MKREHLIIFLIASIIFLGAVCTGKRGDLAKSSSKNTAIIQDDKIWDLKIQGVLNIKGTDKFPILQFTPLKTDKINQFGYTFILRGTDEIIKEIKTLAGLKLEITGEASASKVDCDNKNESSFVRNDSSIIITLPQESKCTVYFKENVTNQNREIDLRVKEYRLLPDRDDEIAVIGKVFGTGVLKDNEDGFPYILSGVPDSFFNDYEDCLIWVKGRRVNSREISVSKFGVIREKKK